MGGGLGGDGGGSLDAGLAAGRPLLKGLQPAGQCLHPPDVLPAQGSCLHLQPPQLGCLLPTGTAVRQGQRAAGTTLSIPAQGTAPRAPRGPRGPCGQEGVCTRAGRERGFGVCKKGAQFRGVQDVSTVLGCARRDRASGACKM